MPRLTLPLPDSNEMQAALAASGVVGVWTHDVWTDRLALSPPLARLLGLDPGEAGGGVPLAAVLAGTHDTDRNRVENVFHAALARGGAFEVAFRTAGGTCWLALRGRIERDAAGRPARGCGIALDRTEDCAGRDGQHTVNLMAEHAIALRALVGDLRMPALTKLLDSLMIEIGFELARHLQEAHPETHDGRRH
ncbi:PAS domain-containing protein [Methylobacterium sp. BTF04]|uniref:PAS domain-containing protein n=1 Tax=Methylobacterium sp. BTF04 TaxID=2708300 RepID=UPI0013D6BB1E|nr:PAS domain-containing protein [Methylobacterium sp. BTF04]NEU11341.1 PAS domain-containing protein [Methylobacterium sp. BTF04]